MSSKKEKIVLAVCGSVAAVEVPKIVRELRREGFEVECVMSLAAQRIIHPDVLTWASGSKVITDIGGGVEHVRLCGINGEASLLLVCPATANTLSKIAGGISDGPVTTFASTALGSAIPVMLAPAMHLSLYRNPLVIENMEKIRGHGVDIIKPKVEEDKAKMADTGEIIKAVIGILKR